jgi:hypothetical protein
MKSFVLLIAIATMVGCTGKTDFGASLKAAASHGPGSVVAFKDLTKFEWDTVYIYGPYHPLNEINKKHDLNLTRSQYEGDHISEGDCLYLFVSQEKVVQTVFGPRYCGQLLEPGVYTREKAVFRVTGVGPNWQLVQ